MVNSDYPVLNIPVKYRTLPNFVAGAYSADFLKLAIAISDVWVADGLGGGGGGGGGGTVSVSNFPATFAATQSGSWTVSTGLSQPLTDAQLRDNPIAVTTGLTQPLTNTELRATPVPISRTERTYTNFRLSTSSSGDNTIIAAQGVGVSIYIAELVVINASSTDTTALLKEGATTWKDVVMPSKGDGIVLSYPFDSEWKLPANTALVGNLSGNNNIIFYGRYRTA